LLSERLAVMIADHVPAVPRAGPDLATLADHQALARPRNIRVTF
jgi:hypothetical protein